MDEEDTLPTKMKSIMTSAGKSVGFGEVEDKLAKLSEALDQTDEEALRVLEQVVPTYTVTKNES
jgi:O-phosphoseryl-tRNA(Cys) synthetase